MLLNQTLMLLKGTWICDFPFNVKTHVNLWRTDRYLEQPSVLADVCFDVGSLCECTYVKSTFDIHIPAAVLFVAVAFCGDTTVAGSMLVYIHI